MIENVLSIKNVKKETEPYEWIPVLFLSGIVWVYVGWILFSIFELWLLGLTFLAVGSVSTVLIFIYARLQLRAKEWLLDEPERCPCCGQVLPGEDSRNGGPSQ